MLNNRLAAARAVAEKLSAFEEAIDQALILGAELTAAAPKARRQVKASPVVGQDMIAFTGEAMAALHKARGKLMKAHASAAEVRDGLGLTTRMTGDAWKLVPSASNLQVIADNDRIAA